MSRTAEKLPGGVRLSDVVSLGALAERVPLSAVRTVIKREGREGKRERLLPPDVTALYIVAMWLFREVSYEEALSCLLEGLRWLGLPLEAVASKGAITQARARLGWEVMRSLYLELASTLAQPQTRGAWYRKWRTVSIDGCTLDVPDTDANEEAFGYPASSRGASAFPQIRAVLLCETGTHAAIACQMAPYATGEVTLAGQVLGALKAGMLLLADRGFFGFGLWQRAQASGADLLWRVKNNQRLPVRKILPDGSFLSSIYPSPDDMRSGTGAVEVRAIEYTVAGSTEKVRLLTSILDPQAAPAEELASLYHERWEAEGVFDEIKTHLKGARVTLRSKTPDLVRQEFWGLMIAHWALRSLIHEAALRQNLDPDDVSFVAALRVVKRTMPHRAALSP